MVRFQIFRACAVLALLVAGCATDPPRVMVLGLDGMDPQAVDLLISQGKMPHFARLRAGGAYGRLASQEPLLSPMIWTTIATGKTPDEHRIGHFLAVHPKTGESLPVTSQMRQVNALWNIFSDAGRDVGVVGWWATWPAEKVRGAIVSDYTCYHFLFADAFRERADVTGLAHPPPLWDEIQPMVQRPTAVGRERLLRFADVEAAELERPIRFDDDLAHLRWALAAAATYHDIGLYLWKKKRPQLLMVYVEAPDTASHLFGHLFGAQELAGQLAEQQRRYGRTVEAIYRYADQMVGNFMAAMDGRTTLVVLSDHGFALGVLPPDPGKLRDPQRVSERFHRPHGILYLYGHQVKPGVALDQPGILDIAPTVLALAGLAVAQDLPGRILHEGLQLERAPVAVATYETKQVEETAVPASRLDEAVLERLRALGDLEAESPRSEQNLAAVYLHQRRYEEAAKAFEELLARTLGAGAVHASLGGVYAAQGHYDEAQAQLAEAERLEPLNAEIYYNRALIYEKRGEKERAIGESKRGLRYDPGYEPARTALTRLTGSAEVYRAASETECAALQRARQASEFARKGHYAAAMKLLDEAAQLAP